MFPKPTYRRVGKVARITLSDQLRRWIRCTSPTCAASRTRDSSARGKPRIIQHRALRETERNGNATSPSRPCCATKNCAIKRRAYTGRERTIARVIR